MIALTHANLKTEIILEDKQIFAIYVSPAMRCTHVLATGGAIVPVVETPAEVRSMMERQDPRVPVTESPEEVQNKIKEINNNAK